MRTVARYQFQAQTPNDQDALDHYIGILQLVEIWLNELGVPKLQQGEHQVRVRSGQRGILRVAIIDLDRTALYSIELEQPIPAGVFQTRLELALLDQKNRCWMRITRYDDEVKHLRRELTARDEQISDLETQLKNLQMSFRWQNETSSDDIAIPDQIPPPGTVIEAANRAKYELSDRLLFGSDVDDGINTLNPTAGPRTKYTIIYA